jgi:hypothetical protein
MVLRKTPIGKMPIGKMPIGKMPIGIQDFEKLRTEKFVYVDKSAYIYKLAGEGMQYFLGRPRRFGKSLFLSSLKAYFLGKRELFEPVDGGPGLAIADLEKDWVKYPVFHFDFNTGVYNNTEGLVSELNYSLRCLEDQWGGDEREDTPAIRLKGLIRRAFEKTGQRVVILVDEYDKPLLQTIENEDLQEEMRRVLKSFYSVFKAADQYLRFVFLTGVTKFSKISIFSDLNQLRDISMENAYGGICGFSASELEETFAPELEALGRERKMSREEVLAEMRKRYNGYRFSKEGEKQYNPFSVLNTLAKQDFDYYWFKTGTPTFLVDALKSSGFDLRGFDEGISISAQSIDDYRARNIDLTPLLYQSGYLTIKDYDQELNEYILGFPNGEVEYGFLNELLPLYVPRPADSQGFLISNFFKDLRSGDADSFMNRLKAFIANIPYDLKIDTEKYYQNVFYLIFTLMGQYTQAEVRSMKGRADMLVFTKDTVFVFEFKLAEEDSRNLAEAAIKQIDSKGYLLPYRAGGKKIVKIGAVFNLVSRGLGNWIVREA